MKGANAKPFKILSLDGGGIRGAFVAGFLADLEDKLGCRLADYFDLIAGTSTGAIIAAALAMCEPAARIEKFYRERGPQIFARRPAAKLGCLGRLKALALNAFLKNYQLDYDNLVQSKYTAEALKSSLAEVFGDKKLGEAKTRLLIPAVDLTRGQPIVFKTPHFPGLWRDRAYRILDVLLATTAAPTYFPHASIKAGTAYVDGGLWVNNPSLAAIAEAFKIRETANRVGVDSAIELDQIFLLSIGTGKASYFATPSPAGEGMFFWGPKLLNVAGVSQSQGINFQAQYFLGDRCHRIDYDLPDGTWSLDSVEMLDQMAAIGHERSNENLAKLAPIFFHEKAQHPFVEFPADPVPTVPS